VPLDALAAVGVNTALMVQEAFPASELPQVLVWVKPALGVIVKAKALAPRLVTLKLLAELVDPTATLPNDVDAGLRVTGATPIPVTEPTVGLPIPL
jgi:hypothetical protein